MLQSEKLLLDEALIIQNRVFKSDFDREVKKLLENEGKNLKK
jgi:hypothetical protein